MPEPIPKLIHALGFSWRKQAMLRQFLPEAQIRFVRHPRRVPDGATVAVWASGPFGRNPLDPTWSEAAQAAKKIRKLYVEDGFLRSVGLGADLVRPLSWVIDGSGIYYDASRPNDLEDLLQSQQFDASLLERAAALRQKLVSTGLTKYNVGTRSWSRPVEAGQKKIVLVAGQVEADAAIRWGAPGIGTNLALLQAAREARPEAWVIYKPHPDVVAGLRNAGQQEDAAFRWCDQIITDISMGTLLESIDELHVMTSLAGFEALLRDRAVVCHGLPFYAGWGLTQDALPSPRRSRRLSVEQLVAGVLFCYPRYVSRLSGQICEVEQALNELLGWRAQKRAELPLWRKLLRPLMKRP